MLPALAPTGAAVAIEPARTRSAATAFRTVGAQTDLRAERALRNRLLEALPANEFARVRPHLEEVHVEQRDVLYEPAETIRYVYFPETAVVSLVSCMSDGSTVEVGTAGYEGMAGLPLFLGDDNSSVRAFAQIPGTLSRMDARTFGRLSSVGGAFHRILLRYTQSFLTQVAQTAACNGAHLLEERCARWVLMTHDRVAGDRFPLTHEFLAFMLGVRRPGVTIAMRALQDSGLVQYTRGWISVVNRPGLERVSCECYRLVRAHNERLLPRIA